MAVLTSNAGGCIGVLLASERAEAAACALPNRPSTAGESCCVLLLLLLDAKRVGQHKRAGRERLRRLRLELVERVLLRPRLGALRRRGTRLLAHWERACRLVRAECAAAALRVVRRARH